MLLFCYPSEDIQVSEKMETTVKLPKDTTEDIRQLLKENLRLSMCINRIVKHIKEKYKYDLSPDEQTFLCIHIKRVMQ